MKSNQFIKIIRRRAILYMQKAFAVDEDIFLHKLVPRHCSKNVKNFFKQDSFTVE